MRWSWQAVALYSPAHRVQYIKSDNTPLILEGGKPLIDGAKQSFITDIEQLDKKGAGQAVVWQEEEGKRKKLKTHHSIHSSW